MKIKTREPGERLVRVRNHIVEMYETEGDIERKMIKYI